MASPDTSATSKRRLEIEDMEMFNFLEKAAKNADSPLNLNKVWMDYVDEHKPQRKLNTLKNRFRNVLAPKLSQLTEFDVESRVRMLFATSTPIDDDLLKEVRDRAQFVEVDEHSRLTLVVWFDVMHLDGKHRAISKKRRSNDTLDEENGEKRRRGQPSESLNVQEFETLMTRQTPPSSSIPIVKQSQSSIAANVNRPNRLKSESTSEMPVLEIAPSNPVESSAVARRPITIKDEPEDVVCITPHAVPSMRTFFSMLAENGLGIHNLINLLAFLNNVASSAAQPDPNSASTKEFLRLLRGMMVTLNFPELSEINERVQAAIDRLGDGDEPISKKKIKTALEATLAMIPAMKE
uniref:SPK domain-containing protein n=1 Tax=Caenorhabditis japonica TaxID=281687 RepID=A0A8R1DLH4_CAEJA